MYIFRKNIGIAEQLRAELRIFFAVLIGSLFLYRISSLRAVGLLMPRISFSRQNIDSLTEAIAVFRPGLEGL